MFKTNLSDIFSDLNTESSVILQKSIKIKNINSVDTIANTTSSFMPQKGGYSDATSSFMPQKGGYLNGTKNKHINQLISMLSATSESNYTTNSTDTEQLKNKLFNIIQSGGGGGGDTSFFQKLIYNIITINDYIISDETNYIKEYKKLDNEDKKDLREYYNETIKDYSLSPKKKEVIEYFGLDFRVFIPPQLPPIISKSTPTSTPTPTPTPTSTSTSTSRVKFPDIASIAPNPDPDPAPTPTPIAPTPTPIAPITPIVSTPIDPTGNVSFFINIINDVFKDSNFTISNNDIKQYLIEYKKLNNASKKLLKEYSSTLNTQNISQLTVDQLTQINKFGLRFNLTDTEEKEMFSILSFIYYINNIIKTNKFTILVNDIISNLNNYITLTSDDKQALYYILFFMNYINKMFNDTNFIIHNSNIQEYLIRYSELTPRDKATLKTYYDTQLDNLIAKSKRKLTYNQLNQITKFGLSFDLTDYQEKEMISILSLIYYINNIIETKKFTIPEIDIIPNLSMFKTLNDNDKTALDYILFFMNYINKIFNDKTFIIPGSEIEEYLIKYRSIYGIDPNIRRFLRKYSKTKIRDIDLDHDKQIKMYGLYFENEREYNSTISFLNSISLFIKYMHNIFSDKYKQFKIPESEIEEYKETHRSLSDDTKEFLHRYYNKYKPLILDKDQTIKLSQYGLTFQTGTQPTIMSPPLE